MANVPDAPKESFRLSMLLYDTRYRSLTIQVFVFMLFMAGAAWLVDNTIRNLAALGKDFNFGFLWNRAGYDISQRLVEYTNDSSHGRAMLVGLLNTLLVAFLGCLAATVIGVLVGVLRLSKNWLVGRLMTAYVELFRNIPLLLWIILIYAVFTEATPAPNAFRPNPETGIASQSMFLDAIAVTNRYTAVPNPVFSRELGWLNLGLFYVNLDVIAVIAAAVLGWWLNRMVKARATRIQNATGIRPATWWSSLLLLVGLPVAVLLGLGFHLEYPGLKGFNFVGGINVSNSFMALWLALSLYTGAFIAEIVRAGIMAISRGQSEAAFALGLRPGRTMSLVILPQALRVIIPPLISQYLNLTKNSSLAIAVGYLDLRGTLGGITLNQTGRELECVLLMMLIYLTISLLISGAMNVYNASVKLKER
ncbi:L-glutamine ABC transporter membrane protein /L-glutamate ABC transporter membrane protein /L-aspartate ABC transporter membrane protein /L-asparagine ABC transporter membrane protein [Cereibacter ovatus]|uniref:L-glutamine ABC transporter membrane protein /L-glutamate ABC transporter membrane protein /L-aspartate ABC transporter membrane protein /L-asparagine ABC transporter membrane protein n=1 Tax=Cereibacter ovatus TaxID=439529 RepID=A0A285CN82_9RHOB|nr:ABC transporter permease subunit [Cereibacter ovatus]SNX68516.1 L-glutamine ABC transporter membrane protein /L-glutamate ABC transporter membrane protein /L-aspartate ABC transporter membrane protein /L-asparagine ABC transporter membrane protein [Cereibacter ovatus]